MSERELATFGTVNHPPFGNYKSADECADRAKHTPDPPGYLAWQEWAEKKAKTHTQHQCPTCGLWAIWKRKPRAAGAVPGERGAESVSATDRESNGVSRADHSTSATLPTAPAGAVPGETQR